MRRFTMTFIAAVAMSTFAMTANAQSQAAGAANLHALAQNATPIISKTACRGWGPYCPLGYTRACDPWHCWCRPCR